jgi:hypothetical protein
MRRKRLRSGNSRKNKIWSLRGNWIESSIWIESEWMNGQLYIYDIYAVVILYENIILGSSRFFFYIHVNYLYAYGLINCVFVTAALTATTHRYEKIQSRRSIPFLYMQTSESQAKLLVYRAGQSEIQGCGQYPGNEGNERSEIEKSVHSANH